MLAYPLYKIHYPKYWSVNDKPKRGYDRESLLFHISKNDYFGTLATVLGLMEEIARNEKLSPEIYAWQLESLRRAGSDLLYLQENYQIVPKDK